MLICPLQLVGADPAAVTVAPLDVGATALEGALTVEPLNGGLTPLGGGAVASAGAAANLAVGGGVNSVDSFNGANLVGGLGGTNGALSLQPLSTGAAGALETGVNGNTNVLAPSLGSPLGGSALPGLSNTRGIPLQTGVPLGGGLANPNSNVPGGLVGGSSALGGGSGLVAPTNPGLLPGSGGVTLQTSVLGGSGLAPQATSSLVSVNGAGRVARAGAVMSGVVALLAAVML